MNIRQMRYVYEVAKTKSMNRAAENLKTAQPNISRQIGMLEKELGIIIFERSTHGTTLPFAEIRRDVFHDDAARKIYVFERGSQFDLLARNTGTFMWVSPIPDNTLDRFDLIQRPCADNVRRTDHN